MQVLQLRPVFPGLSRAQRVIKLYRNATVLVTDPRIKTWRRMHPVWEDHQELAKVTQRGAIESDLIIITDHESNEQRVIKPIPSFWPKGIPPCFVGKWQYFYEYGDKKIDLVQLVDSVAIEMKAPREWGPYVEWEICSGGTVPECDDAEERFQTKAEAEKRIEELLLLS